MGKLSEMLPTSGNYLRADDLPENAAIRVAIDCVRIEQIKRDEETEEKPVLYFTGKDKGLVLNRTNVNTLVSLFGDDETAIMGKQVVLYRTLVPFGGKTVPALRLRGVDEPPNDEIPF